jgi:hypothetical protein
MECTGLIGIRALAHNLDPGFCRDDGEFLTFVGIPVIGHQL